MMNIFVGKDEQVCGLMEREEQWIHEQVPEPVDPVEQVPKPMD